VNRKLYALNKEHGAQDFDAYDFNKSNLRVASKIITHYYEQNYTTENLHNKKISIIVGDRMGPGYTDIQFNDGTRGLGSAICWTNSSSDNSYIITFKFQGGLSSKKGHFRIDAPIRNSSDLNILLKHEHFHSQNHKNVDVENGDNSLIKHLDAYYNSIAENSDWQKTSEDFRNYYSGAIGNYINQIQNENKRNAQVKRFQKYLDAENKDDSKSK
jgi:hypothetical protein